jgi:hypothetical protein
MAGDRDTVGRLLTEDPRLRERAAPRPAGAYSCEAAALLIELGFDVNVRPRMAPLYEAAMRGNLAAIRRLLTTAPTPTSTTRSMTRRRRDGRTITATARSAVSCSKDSSDPTRPPR